MNVRGDRDTKISLIVKEHKRLLCKVLPLVVTLRHGGTNVLDAGGSKNT
jgi:hypothetical protein